MEQTIALEQAVPFDYTGTPKEGPSKAVRDSLVLAERKLLKIKHSPDQMIDVIVLPVMFMLLFTFLFGGAIAGDTASYLSTIVPGMLVFCLLSCSSSTGAQLLEDLETGIFDRFKSLPIARIAPLAGPLLADIPRYMIAAGIACGMGCLLGWRPVGGLASIGASIVFASLFAWAVSWVFAFVGLLGKRASVASALSQVVTIVLIFASNAFVPTETLPDWLQAFVQVNPVTHIISAIHGITETGALANSEVLVSLGFAAFIVAVFAPLILLVYNKKM